jgi:uncharacterized membrane protein
MIRAVRTNSAHEPFHFFIMPLTTQPFAQMKELETLRKSLLVNVSFSERIGSVVGGLFLMLFGAARKSIGGLLLALFGGGLMYRGATGHCDVYEHFGVNTNRRRRERGVPGNTGIKLVRSITISKSPEDAFRYWRQLENLPRFMKHLKEVRVIDARRSHWVVDAPAGSTVEWDAEIIAERTGEFISWQSLEGAQVQNAGSVWFEPASGGGARVRVSIQYQPPGGALGAGVAAIFGDNPEEQVAEDLRRFKDLLEGRGTAAGAKR